MNHWNSTFKIKRKVIVDAHRNIPSGTTVNNYTVVERGLPYIGYRGHIMYICRCNDCGQTKLIKAADIMRKKTTACANCKKINRVAKQGEKFGQLTITRLVKAGRRKDFDEYECLCSCGNIKIAKWRDLYSGHTKSCGCLHYRRGEESPSYRHGGMNDPTYTSYRAMKERCYNPNYHHYHRYGGRGIKVCEEWLEDYASFRDWAIKNGYKKGLSLDRINNDGDYCPENCRWTTQKEQVRNSSRVKKSDKGIPLTEYVECGNIKELRKYGLKVWAQLVKARANYTCELCGRPGTDAHHWLFNRADHSITDITPSNGCCLCRMCHIEAHNKVAEYKIKIRKAKGNKFNNLSEDHLLRVRIEDKTAKDYYETIKRIDRELKELKKKRRTAL